MSHNPILKKLLQPESISVLELILEQDVALLGRLQKKQDDGVLVRNEPLSLEDYHSCFPVLKTKIDNFLGVQDISTPQLYEHSTNTKYKYYGLGAGVMAGGVLLGLYVDHHLIPTTSLSLIPLVMGHIKHQGDDCEGTYVFGKIEINDLKRPREQILPIVGHEYVHHIQREKGLLSLLDLIIRLNSTERLMLLEGHACGVQRYLADQYAQEQDNEAFLYYNRLLDVPKLKRLYTWLCDQSGKKPLPKFEEKGFRSGLEVHAVGLGYFLVQEHDNGLSAYADWLKTGN